MNTTISNKIDHKKHTIEQIILYLEPHDFYTRFII